MFLNTLKNEFDLLNDSFLLKMGKVIPKRKQWSSEQSRGPKRVKVEVKSTQTEETQCLTDGMSNEAYELMVKGRDS